MAAFAFALIASAAVRVASLDLCADEYLLLLAREGQVAAVSRLSHDPAESPLWKAARRFPAYGGRIETLLPARPTHLLAVGAPGGQATESIARRLGLKVLTLPYPASPHDVIANADRVASILGTTARLPSYRQRLARLGATPSPLRDAIFLSGGGLSVGPDGLSAQWMRLAGLRQRTLPGGRLTLEHLATRPPQVLLRSDYRSGQASLGQRWIDHPLANRSTARTIVTDGRRWTCGGLPMIEEIERLKALR